MSNYKGILTNKGKELLANATMGNRVNFSHLALGDGNGSVPTLNESRTSLVKERHRLALNSVDINPNNRNQIVCETIIPTNVGGFTVRELGLYVGNTLVMHSTYPPTYKPRQDEGGAREMVIRVVINVQNADVIALYLDTSLVYATREWTETNFVNHAEVVNNLTSTDTNRPLSAAQGKKLYDEKLAKTENAVSATKLQTARTISMTGDGTGRANFDGTANASIALTLANSGVTAGSYNSVTVDAKGRVTAGLTQTHGLVTATTATGTANTATTNANTFLNIVASGVGQTSSVGSSTQITGANGITVSSDTAGKLIVARDSNSPTATKLQTARTISMTGDGTGRANFDGTANASIALTLANSGVTAGSYNSVTVDAKGRVTAGLTQTHGLVTATTATGTANTATTNANTFLNIVASGVGQTSSVGSSTQITGANGITVSSDTAGKLIVARDSNSPTATKLQTARTINGVAFDGTQNITIADNTKAPAVHRHNWSEIDDKPAIITNPTRITSGDLDNYKETGVYYCDVNVHAQNIANTPSNRAFALEVVRAAGVVQIFREYNTAIVYMRAFYNRWSPWKCLATTEDNAPTATKLQTARKIALTGAVTGSVNFDGSGNVSLATTLNLTDFANNKNENGYQKLPNGLILQWGNKPDHSAVVFPVAFPNSVLNVSLTLKVNSRDSDNQEAFGVHSVTNTGFSIFNWVHPSQGCYWFAIGY